MTSTSGPIEDVDVLVVGGGVVGAATAWQLAARGREVLLLERFGPRHALGASHGASRIFRHTYPDPTYIRLAREAGELWRELERVTGSSLLTPTGGIDHGEDAALDALAAALEAEHEEYHWLLPIEASERWPGLDFRGRVLYTPSGGRLHADDAVDALKSAAAQAGATIRHDVYVTGLRPEPDKAHADLADGSHVRARTVVVAAGAWTPDLLGALVPLPTITVTQEQPAHFASRIRDDAWPSFVHHVVPGSSGSSSFGGTYGLLTPGEGLKVGFHGKGPIVHPDHRDFLPEPRQLEALRAYARSWLPGVDADTFEPVSCTYATTDDAHFVLDRRGPIVVGAGFSGHGFKFGPALGRVLADLVDGEPSAPRFRLDADRSGSARP